MRELNFLLKLAEFLGLSCRTVHTCELNMLKFLAKFFSRINKVVHSFLHTVSLIDWCEVMQSVAAKYDGKVEVM